MDPLSLLPDAASKCFDWATVTGDVVGKVTRAGDADCEGFLEADLDFFLGSDDFEHFFDPEGFASNKHMSEGDGGNPNRAIPDESGVEQPCFVEFSVVPKMLPILGLDIRESQLEGPILPSAERSIERSILTGATERTGAMGSWAKGLEDARRRGIYMDRLSGVNFPFYLHRIGHAFVQLT